MDLFAALLWYVALLFSLCCHEAAHGWAAQRGGDPTAYLGGQVTLDPRPHIRREPFGTVVMPLLSYSAAGWMIGWASTPYDPHWAARHPRRAAWMALAGPAANAGLVLLAALAVRLGLAAGVFDAPASIAFDRVVASVSDGVWATIASLVSILFTLNLVLLVFNLIPLPPLDGAGALGLMLPERLALRLRLAFARPGWAWIGIVAAWIAIGEVLPPVHRAAIRLLYPEFAYS
ncbi:MAG TPA: site-2 protease family protein [Myxococcota bacterium]|nr:site-2 protease family protein [Myxococcota bacterium]